jgi:hypothetical protein
MRLPRDFVLPVEIIEKKIFLIRGQKVMTDRDLADLYGVPTKRLNEQVRRNMRRFPSDFMFRLTSEEESVLRSQIATSKPSRGGRRYAPFVFTEQGIAMLSSVLNSERAIQVNIAIMRLFVKLRDTLRDNRKLSERLQTLEDTCDANFKVVFKAIRELMDAPVIPERRRIGSISRSLR